MEDKTLRVSEHSSDWNPKHLDIVAGAFVACLLMSNVAAAKLFSLGPAVFTCGILIFPLSYIFGDILTEVYGYTRTRRIIWLGMLANVLLVATLQISVSLPPAPGWLLQDAFAAVHAVVPRIVIASLVAYAIGEFANSMVISQLKVRMQGRKLWFRSIASTVVGQFLDSALFVAIAFGGIMPISILLAAVISSWIFKIAYEVVIYPLTFVCIKTLKRLEGVEHFDVHTDYNPLRLRM
jgi:uncharacterized integral membrane protein (TIGR00697 family)